MKTRDFYVIRYRSEVPLKRRKHAHTLGRFESFGDAEDQRLREPNAEDLDVFRREQAVPA